MRIWSSVAGEAWQYKTEAMCCTYTENFLEEHVDKQKSVKLLN